MITTQNYFQKVKEINLSDLSKKLKDGYDFAKEITENHKTWDYYKSDKDIKSTVDEYLANLSEYLQKQNSYKKVAVVTPVHKNEVKKEAAKIPVKKAAETNMKPKPTVVQAKPVERVDEEIRFIKRYTLMNGKEKTKEQVLSFLNTLQKAILEKRIRKTSPFAKEIEYIQNNLTKLYNVMGKKVEWEINEEVLEKFLAIAGSEKIRLSITYLKRYIGIQGKKLTKEKAIKLMTLMENAVNKEKIAKSDPYADRFKKAYLSLVKFSKTAKKDDTLEVHPAILNGINQALNGCGSHKNKGELHGIDESVGAAELQTHQNEVMNSMDFANLKFDTIGFTGKWKDLIGDPSKGFTAMVFGKPKMGKSYLCVDFAGYLARNHGNTLYVATEEKLDKTLQDKLNDKNVKHPNLYVSDHLPDDLSPYQFIFLDSVNKLGLKPEDLERLKVENPGKSFVYIFQTTKEGNFRGANQFQHDVDVVIEVPEIGKATQFGRFNQGGEMNIFETDLPIAA